MSRRKQLKPKALRKDESDELESESLPVVASQFSEEQSSNELNVSDESTVASDSSEIGESETVERLDQENHQLLCSYCTCSFETYSQLKQHEQEHADLMPYRCSLCGKGFKHKRSQDRHQKLHSGIRKYKCTLCETAFFRSDHLKLHMKTHETSKYPFACLVCQRGFNSSSTLEAHMQIHNGSKSSVMLNSGFSLESSSNQSPTPPSTVCSVCKLRLSSVDELLRHLDEDHRVLNELQNDLTATSRPASLSVESHLSVCPFCHKTNFTSDEAFQLHLEAVHNAAPLLVGRSRTATPNNNHHGNAKPRITCGLCPETFDDVGMLQKHTLHHHSLKDLGGQHQQNNFDPTYSCDECGRVFDSILSLHNHVNSTHSSSSSTATNSNKSSAATYQNGASSPQIYQCGQCDTGLQNLKAFTAHMRQHLDLKQREQHCDFCGLAFGNESTRDAHLITHYLHKESQYSCKTCNKTFTVPEELQKHLMDIHAIHLYRCSLCKDVFESRVDIQVHFAVAHSNEVVRYRCRSCNAAFPSEDQFNVHLQVVHLQRPLVANCQSSSSYFCSLCQKTFANEREHNVVHNHHVVPTTAAMFCCPICGDSFAVEYLYDKHIENVHRNQMDYCAMNFATSPSSKSSSACLMPAPSNSVLMRNSSSSNFPSTTPTVIKCNICDEKCDTVVELARHKLQHCKVIHSEICNVCQEPVASVEQFYAHTRRHTVHGVPMSCVVCKQSLISLVEMQAHAKFHLKLLLNPNNNPTDRNSPPQTENSLLKCAQCNVKFEDEDELKKHTKNDHNNENNQQKMSKSYQCIKCQKSFATEPEIRAHVASHVLQDGVNHHCLLCKKIFDSPSKLQRHLIEHSFAGCVEFQCYLCDMIFSSAEPLQQHMLTKHSLDDRPYECRMCEQKFFFRAELENHSFSHPQQPSLDNSNNDEDDNKNNSTLVPSFDFVCRNCGLVLTSPVALNSHSIRCCRAKSATDDFDPVVNEEYDEKRVPSTNSTSGSHPCPHCPKVFHSISALQGHSHVHMNSKVHQCVKCKKVFQTAAKLRNHQRQHNGDKPFPCEFCGRFFSRKDNLKVHMKIHFKNGSVSPTTISGMTMEPPTMVTSPTFSRELSDFNFDASSNGSNNSTTKDYQDSFGGYIYNLRSHSVVNDVDTTED